MEIYIEKVKRVMIIRFLWINKLKNITCLHFFELKGAGNCGTIFNLQNNLDYTLLNFINT